jgi:hypothetical protein
MIFFISANVLFLFIILFYESGRYIRMNALPHNYVLLVQIVNRKPLRMISNIIDKVHNMVDKG